MNHTLAINNIKEELSDVIDIYGFEYREKHQLEDYPDNYVNPEFGFLKVEDHVYIGISEASRSKRLIVIFKNDHPTRLIQVSDELVSMDGFDLRAEIYNELTNIKHEQ